ncbi:MAG: DUF4386 family protein [Coriobacteriia bacterium]
MDRQAHHDASGQKAGGVAALYLALAYLAAMPYFLVVVDYPGATTVADKVSPVLGNYSSMYTMYLATYVFFGIALGVVVFALYDRLRSFAPSTMRVATAVGLLWSFALVMSGMVFNYGMTTVVSLANTDIAQARVAWQAIEPIAQGLGGAGGEVLGGLWVLLVSWVALRGGAFSKALIWLGMAVGAMGLVSIVPPLHEAAYAFGLLQIVWLVWLGVTMAKKPAAVETRWITGASAVEL